ncbi:MAG: GatB/YqeY domain-containing protein [Desulfovibrionaceae bacterium]|nr:GatB/YqeY domain-containing protein [Desulfovibrionaceae bacterium]
MTLSELIDQDYVKAYKAKDAVRLSVLRLLKTAAKNQLVELRRNGGMLDDAEMMAVIIKQGKQRQDSIEQYNAAGRPDLAEKEAAELSILQSYLPKPLTEDELAAAIEEAVRGTGASSPKDMGKVMSAIMGAYTGRVDGKALSAAVRQRLSR